MMPAKAAAHMIQTTKVAVALLCLFSYLITNHLFRFQGRGAPHPVLNEDGLNFSSGYIT
jgi:hypothetical protein